MVNKYDIHIHNESGSTQNYVLFTELSKVNGAVPDESQRNIFTMTSIADRGEGSIEISKQYFATLGYSHEDPDNGVTIKVSSKQPVDLGSVGSDGKLVPGTTCKMVAPSEIPEFSTEAVSAGGEFGSFKFITDDSFNVAIAEKKKFFIGLAGSSVDGGYTTPTAVIAPLPKKEYQIRPINIFYLAFGHPSAGEKIDTTKLLATALKVDFNSIPNSSKKDVYHNANGQLTIRS